MLTRSLLRLAQARERIEQHDSLTPLRDWLLQLAEREIHLVEWTWRAAQRPGLRRTAAVVSWLGNGLAYLLLGLVVLVTARQRGMAARHRRAGHGGRAPDLPVDQARLQPAAAMRPARRARAEPGLARPHSFPSGHAMTLAAALVPIMVAYPATWPLAVATWLLMAWSRVACAHHYPSDVIAGGVLGVVVALPLTTLLP